MAIGGHLVVDKRAVQRQGGGGEYNPFFAHAYYLAFFPVGIDYTAGFVLIVLQTEFHPFLHPFKNFVLRHSGNAEIFAEYHFAVFFGDGTGQILAVVALLGLQSDGQAEAEHE